MVFNTFTIPTHKPNAYIVLLLYKNDKGASLGQILPYNLDFFSDSLASRY